MSIQSVILPMKDDPNFPPRRNQSNAFETAQMTMKSDCLIRMDTQRQILTNEFGGYDLIMACKAVRVYYDTDTEYTTF